MRIRVQDAIPGLLLAAACLTAAACASPVAGSATPAASSQAEVSTRASAALTELAAAYSAKERAQFMRLVSADYAGSLGTLEDALSADFRTYRTIDLSIVVDQAVAQGLKSQVQFHYNLAVTNAQGQSVKSSGAGAYTFVDERGRAKLLRMDRTPIFGTSLPAGENPSPRSQGPSTATPVTK